MKLFIKETLEQAGDEIMKFYGSREVLYTKEHASDVVTKADLASNRIIVEAIKEKFPDHGIVSEEDEGYQITAENLWYIDPLDGTRNFSTTVPLFGINISMANNGVVTHAAIYQPITKEFVYAEAGQGTFLNGEKVTFSKVEKWENSYGLTPISPSLETDAVKQKIYELSNKTAWMNSLASSAVAGALVSTGRRDWYFTPNSNTWDLAANSLIAKEAGAVVTNLAGEDYKPGDQGLVIANETLHPKLLEIVKNGYGV